MLIPSHPHPFFDIEWRWIWLHVKRTRWALLIAGFAWGILGLLLLLPLAHATQGGLLKFDRTQRHLKADPEFVKTKLAV